MYTVLKMYNPVAESTELKKGYPGKIIKNSEKIIRNYFIRKSFFGDSGPFMDSFVKETIN